MYGHVARQPIFDKNLNIFGYELLFRDGALTFPTDVSGDTATSELLSSTFLTSDIYTYTGIKKAFVNFTRNHLVNRIPLLFPREITVVEILEDVSPEADVVAACQEIAQKGFTIALARGHPGPHPLNPRNSPAAADGRRPRQGTGF